MDRIYVQAKRYSDGNSVGSGAIRDFFGSLDRFKAAKGLFVTTSSFSPAARETAEFLSKRIVLIDGRQLAKLMIRFNVGCRVEETIELKKVDEEFLSERRTAAPRSSHSNRRRTERLNDALWQVTLRGYKQTLRRCDRACLLRRKADDPTLRRLERAGIPFSAMSHSVGSDG